MTASRLRCRLLKAFSGDSGARLRGHKLLEAFLSKVNAALSKSEATAYIFRVTLGHPLHA
jgi:hypothetical protein